MLHFFRKIRHDLIANSKSIKYLKYAIGEIVLVVLGILIALQINNRNEQRQSEIKIDVLFEKVLNELAVNINETQSVIQWSKLHDSLNILVQNNRLTYDDYANPKVDKNGNWVIRNLFWGANAYSWVFLNTSAYDNLLLNMDAIPAKYDDVVTELDVMYQRSKRAMDISNVEMTDLADDIETEHRLKYDWYHLEVPNEGIIDYMLNNYLYKNEMFSYSDLNTRQLHRTLGYRNSAIKIYQELAVLLNKPKIHQSFKVNPEIVRLITGTYNFIESSNSSVNEQEYLEVVKFENNLIMTYQPRDTTIAWESTVVDFKKTKSKASISILRNSGAVYLTYVVEGDTLTVKNNGGAYWKFIKVK